MHFYIMALAAVIMLIIAFSRVAEFKHSEIFEQGDKKLTTAFRKKVFPFIFWLICIPSTILGVGLVAFTSGGYNIWQSILLSTLVIMVTAVPMYYAIGVKKYGPDVYELKGRMDGEKGAKIMNFAQAALLLGIIGAVEVPFFLNNFADINYYSGLNTFFYLLFSIAYGGIGIIFSLIVKKEDVPFAAATALSNSLFYFGVLLLPDAFSARRPGFGYISVPANEVYNSIVIPVGNNNAQYSLVINVFQLVMCVIMLALGIAGHCYIRHSRNKNKIAQ